MRATSIIKVRHFWFFNGHASTRQRRERVLVSARLSRPAEKNNDEMVERESRGAYSHGLFYFDVRKATFARHSGKGTNNREKFRFGTSHGRLGWAGL